MALPSLEALLDSRHELVAVVSQPDRGRGRGRKRSPSPVAARAADAGVDLLRPENVGEDATAEALARAKPDLGVVVAFGQFIPKRIRTLPRLGYLINGHASLLPRYRGAAPVAHAILDGERYTGVSVMRVERAMDAGPVALARRLEIGAEETTGELTVRLSQLAADLLLESLDAIAEGSVQWAEQDHHGSSEAPKITRDDARIDWNRDASSCVRQINAMAPKPGAFTSLGEGPGKPAILRILRARPYSGSKAAPIRPGELRLAEDDEAPPLRIGTGEGWLVPLEVQRSGGKTMDPGAFLRGHPLENGMILGGGSGVQGDP